MSGRSRGFGGGTPALQPLDRLFELLIAILQLFHATGQVADLLLEAIDARDEIGVRRLRVSVACPQCSRQCQQES